MTTIDRLTPELLLMITELLSPVDCFSFVICCHRLYVLSFDIVKLWRPLKSDAKFCFITRLERDVPTYFACKFCNVLHRYDESLGFGICGIFPERGRLPCVAWNGEYSGWFSPKGRLFTHLRVNSSMQHMTYLHLKLAMRRFHFGPECGISTDSLSHTQVIEESLWHNRSKVTWLFSRQAQICTEPLGLYVRIQEILLFSEWSDVVGPGYGHKRDFVALCMHDVGYLRELSYSWRRHKARENPESSTHLDVRCRICNTVCHIELCEIHSKGAIILTKWFNLGPGQDEEDLLWKTHSLILHPVDPHCGFDPNYSVSEQCARRHFEEAVSQSFEELRVRNMSYLKDKEYTRVMRYVRNRKAWYSPFREPSTNRIVNFGRSLQAFLGIVSD